jgi:hypothetical protein
VLCAKSGFSRLSCLLFVSGPRLEHRRHAALFWTISSNLCNGSAPGRSVIEFFGRRAKAASCRTNE